MSENENPEWVTRGKTIQQLIEELKSFEDQNLEVKVSTDGGDKFSGISLVTRENCEGKYFCGLVNYE